MGSMSSFFVARQRGGERGATQRRRRPNGVPLTGHEALVVLLLMMMMLLLLLLLLTLLDLIDAAAGPPRAVRGAIIWSW
jgi:hypothetical protein